MLIADIINAKGRLTVTIDPNANLVKAAKVLKARRVGALLVVDGSHTLVGILTERDIVRAMADGGKSGLRLTVANAMTRDVKTCTVEDEPQAVASLMARYQIRHVPVVENGKLAGLVSVRDLMQARLEEQSKEAFALVMMSRCRPTRVGRRL